MKLTKMAVCAIVAGLAVAAYSWRVHGSPLGEDKSVGACDGDITGDGGIDLEDYEYFADCLAGPGVLADPTPRTSWADCLDCFDYDGDLDVDLADFAGFQCAFGGFPGPAPEGMVLVPGGEFEMGDHYGVGAPSEVPVHTVYVDSFYMDVYEVTNQQYVDYLNPAYAQGLIEVRSGVVYAVGGEDPYCHTVSCDGTSRIHWDGSTFTVTVGREDHPLAVVTWYGAAAYSNWRSQVEGRPSSYDLATWECDFASNGYRLPTEAEWEYAARGGLHSPYYKYPWGNDIDGSKANYWQSGDPYELEDFPATTPVGYYDGGQTPPGSDMANGYGLYDMAGNVFEWCNDWFSATYYSSSPYDNPRGPDSGSGRVLRGGSWYSSGVHGLRCASRRGSVPGHPCNIDGCRLVLGSE